MISIIDDRDNKNFKKISFSNYKKSDVIKELNANLKCQNIEQSCYWGSELICAGHYKELWSIIILFYSKYIHISNPKLISFIYLKIHDFKKIVNNLILSDELELRNNENIRILFAELTCILILSKRTHHINRIKMTVNDYDVINFNNKMTTKNMSYINKIYLDEDPKDLMNAFNEFAFSISSEQKNNIDACYWLEWILGLLKKCKKNKICYKCEHRDFPPVLDKHKKDIIWIFWDIILKESLSRDKLIQKIINEALYTFSLRYTYSLTPKYINLLYFSISLLTESVCFKNNIITDINKIKMTKFIQKINSIYIQIKKNETHKIQGNDKSYDETNKIKNYKESINKFDILNNFSEIFTPQLNK
jgi:hypothetical protein